MTKDDGATRNRHHDQPQPARSSERMGPPNPCAKGHVRRRPKGWLQAIAERFGAFPAED